MRNSLEIAELLGFLRSGLLITDPFSVVIFINQKKMVINVKNDPRLSYLRISTEPTTTPATTHVQIQE